MKEARYDTVLAYEVFHDLLWLVDVPQKHSGGTKDSVRVAVDFILSRKTGPSRPDNKQVLLGKVRFSSKFGRYICLESYMARRLMREAQIEAQTNMHRITRERLVKNRLQDTDTI